MGALVANGNMEVDSELIAKIESQEVVI